jgi:hypothetical protein
MKGMNKTEEKDNINLSIDDLDSVSGGETENGITSKFNLGDTVHVKGYYSIDWTVDTIYFKKTGAVYDVKCSNSILERVPESDMTLAY